MHTVHVNIHMTLVLGADNATKGDTKHTFDNEQIKHKYVHATTYSRKLII